MNKFILLILITIIFSGCSTISEEKAWSIYKMGFTTGVDCRGMMSAPSCMIFLDEMEGLE